MQSPFTRAVMLASFGPFLFPLMMWQMAQKQMTRSNVCGPK